MNTYVHEYIYIPTYRISPESVLSQRYSGENDSNDEVFTGGFIVATALFGIQVFLAPEGSSTVLLEAFGCKVFLFFQWYCTRYFA
jgi:hypothetical protein